MGYKEGSPVVYHSVYSGVLLFSFTIASGKGEADGVVPSRGYAERGQGCRMEAKMFDTRTRVLENLYVSIQPSCTSVDQPTATAHCLNVLHQVSIQSSSPCTRWLLECGAPKAS